MPGRMAKMGDVEVALVEAHWTRTNIDFGQLTQLQINQLHEYMAKVVRFFWNPNKKDPGDLGDDGGSDGDEALIVRGVGVVGMEDPPPGGHHLKP